MERNPTGKGKGRGKGKGKRTLDRMDNMKNTMIEQHKEKMAKFDRFLDLYADDIKSRKNINK